MPAEDGLRARFGRLAVPGPRHVLVRCTGCMPAPPAFGAAAGLERRLLVAGVVTTVRGAGAGRFLGVRTPVRAGPRPRR